jgi:hypothetical protein
MEEEKLEAFVNMRLLVPIELDYKLRVRLAELKKLGIRKSKATLLLECAAFGLLNNKL